MAVTTPASISEFTKAIDPGVRKHLNNDVKLLEPMLEYVFKVETQEDYVQEEEDYSGLGAMATVQPGENYPEDANIQIYNTVYNITKKGDLYPIQNELLRWGKEKTIFNGAKAQGNKVARQIEKDASMVYNRAFSSSYTSYGDGASLISTSHTRADGGTARSNKSTGNINLTESNLEVGLIAGGEVLNHRGHPINSMFDCLVVPLALEKEAIIITGSDQRSGTADNDLNVYKGGLSIIKGSRLKIVSWRYLGAYLGGSDTAWFLLDSGDIPVRWNWGMKPRFNQSNEQGFKNDVLYYRADYEHSTGWEDPIGRIWGSTGT
ncbi:MAG: hypothetical protein ACFFD2_11070 [Promethearchaeota archaeon]